MELDEDVAEGREFGVATANFEVLGKIEHRG